MEKKMIIGSDKQINRFKKEIDKKERKLHHPVNVFDDNINDNFQKIDLPDFTIIMLGKLLNYICHRQYLEKISANDIDAYYNRDVYVKLRDYDKDKVKTRALKDVKDNQIKFDDLVYKFRSRDINQKTRTKLNDLIFSELSFKKIPLVKTTLGNLVSNRYMNTSYLKDGQLRQRGCSSGVFDCDMCFNEDIVSPIEVILQLDRRQSILFRKEVYRNNQYDPNSSLSYLWREEDM